MVSSFTEGLVLPENKKTEKRQATTNDLISE